MQSAIMVLKIIKKYIGLPKFEQTPQKEIDYCTKNVMRRAH